MNGMDSQKNHDLTPSSSTEDNDSTAAFSILPEGSSSFSESEERPLTDTPSTSSMKYSTSGDTLQTPPANLPSKQSCSRNIFTSPVVTLVVGQSSGGSQEEEKMTFYVHKDMLTMFSSFFQAALADRTNGQIWREGRDGIIKLPDDRASDFGALISWLYQNHESHSLSPLMVKGGLTASVFRYSHPEIDNPICDYMTWKGDRAKPDKKQGSQPNGGSDVRRRPAPPNFKPLIRLYLLGDKYGLWPIMLNQLAWRVLEVGSEANCVPSQDEIEMVWNSIHTSDNRMKLTIINMYGRLDKKSFSALFGDTESTKWHPSFVHDLLLHVVVSKAREADIHKVDL